MLSKKNTIWYAKNTPQENALLVVENLRQISGRRRMQRVDKQGRKKFYLQLCFCFFFFLQDKFAAVITAGITGLY